MCNQIVETDSSIDSDDYVCGECGSAFIYAEGEESTDGNHLCFDCWEARHAPDF